MANELQNKIIGKIGKQEADANNTWTPSLAFGIWHLAGEWQIQNELCYDRVQHFFCTNGT